MWSNVEDSKDWFSSIVQTLWPDRPGYSGLVDAKTLKKIQEEEGLSEEDIEREYGVSFSTGLKGSYYAESITDAYRNGRVRMHLYNDTLPVNTFWDIGIDDSDACWFGQEDGDAVKWIDYFEDSNIGTDDIAKMLSNKGYDYDTHYLPHDAGHRKKGRQVFTTAEELADSLRDFKVGGTIEVLPKTGSVQASIQGVRKRFPHYWFDPVTCKTGLEKLALYHKVFDKRRKVFMQKPHHDENSHAADAIRAEAESFDTRCGQAFFDINNIQFNTDFDVFGIGNDYMQHNTRYNI
jgi:hypothetical protein